MASSPVEKPRNKSAIATARIIPGLLCLIAAYCSYVVVGPLSVDYLIHTPDGVQPRVAAGIAIPVVWFFLLLPVAAAWLRLLIVILREPGYVPLGDDDQPGEVPPEIWMRDVFVCDQGGLPIWCNYCHNWKPDRAHHSRDIGRCTARMDHFCPWVGGVVGERSFKFFVQFLFYSMILAIYLTTLMAYFVHEDHSRVQWIVVLGLAGFFLLFTVGMVINSVHLILSNVTTIESIGVRSNTMLLAVLLPPEMQSESSLLPPSMQKSRSRSNGDNESERPLRSEIDDPSHANYFSSMSVHRPPRRPLHNEHWRGTVTYPLRMALPTDRPPLPAPTPRTFAILESAPGMNIWDLGTPWRNFTAILGNKPHDWLLPIKHSPACAHDSTVSQYPLGPDFEDLLVDSGLVQDDMRPAGPESMVTSSSRRKRKRRLARGWQNGERPDGWVSEKEARRQRNERRSIQKQREREEDAVV